MSWTSSSPTFGPHVRPTLPDRAGPVALDTDVASLILKGRDDGLAAELVRRTWCVSFVTIGELVKWAEATATFPERGADLP